MRCILSSSRHPYVGLALISGRFWKSFLFAAQICLANDWRLFRFVLILWFFNSQQFSHLAKCEYYGVIASTHQLLPILANGDCVGDAENLGWLLHTHIYTHTHLAYSWRPGFSVQKKALRLRGEWCILERWIRKRVCTVSLRCCCCVVFLFSMWTFGFLFLE